MKKSASDYISNRVWKVNYLLFGYISKLCGFSRANMEALIVLALLFTAVSSGCHRPAAPGTSMDKQKSESLVSSCSNLVVVSERTGQEFFKGTNQIPQAIQALNPQIVQVLRIRGSTFVDIQVSGGFHHQGYLVVVGTTDPDFTPSKGRNWTVRKVSDRVFEYTK